VKPNKQGKLIFAYVYHKEDDIEQLRKDSQKKYGLDQKDDD